MKTKYAKDSLGTRMKLYENVSQHSLMKRTPVIIRLDGKAFHTFVKKINTTNDPSLINGPFSEKLHWVMLNTALHLATNIQNTKLCYTQSDEISILLNDWTHLNTEQWFNGNIQKITSVSASIATAYFNHFFQNSFNRLELSPINDLAFFDSRVFNIPHEEVTNYFIWRQQDACRNSIQQLGRHFFTHSELYKKNTSEIIEMLQYEHNVDWNTLENWKKYGSSIISPQSANTRFIVDQKTPVFTQNREYIEQHLIGEN